MQNHLQLPSSAHDPKLSDFLQEHKKLQPLEKIEPEKKLLFDKARDISSQRPYPLVKLSKTDRVKSKSL